MLGLLAPRLHRLRQGAGLSRNQRPAGPDQGLALPQGPQGAGHRIRRFPGRPDRDRRAPRSSLIPAISAGTGSSVTEILTLLTKALSKHAKSGPERAKFTLCLPGSPKVNAGGAYALGRRRTWAV